MSEFGDNFLSPLSVDDRAAAEMDLLLYGVAVIKTVDGKSNRVALSCFYRQAEKREAEK